MSSGILLDLDDTLYPERSYFESGVRAVGHWVAARVDDSTAAASIWADVEAHGRDGFINRIAVPPGHDEASWRLALVQVYRTHEPTLSLFDDVADFIARARRSGARLGVITDGYSRVQWRKAEALGIPALVDAVLCTNDINAPKPAPEGFAAAATLLGVDPRACTYLADDASKDFLGPHALGMSTIQVTRDLPWPLAQPATSPQAHAHHRVDSLTAAADLLGLAAGPAMA